MKMFKTIPVFILLFTGYLCNAQEDETAVPTTPVLTANPSLLHTPPAKEFGAASPAADSWESDYDPAGRSLPTLVVAGVSIALVLLCILIVAISWYAWKKSQEGSIELNPIPYGEAGVSLRSLSVPENQQEWPLERAVQ